MVRICNKTALNFYDHIFLKRKATHHCHLFPAVVSIVNRFSYTYDSPITYEELCDMPSYNTNFQKSKKSGIHQGKRRTKTLHEYLYGRTVCEIALKRSKRPIFKLLASDNWESRFANDEKTMSILHEAAERQIPIEYKPNSYLFNISDGRPHQGLCLEVGRFVPLTANVDVMLSESSESSLWVLLDRILDPMNVGAVLRTCHFLGIEKVILTSNCAPINSTVSKASSGAAEILPIYSVSKPEHFVQNLISNDWDIIGADAAPEVESIDKLDFSNHESAKSLRHEDIRNVKLAKATLLILGNEGFGISNNLMSLCSKLVSILPSNDRNDELVSCLNVSAAAAIILHKLIENR